MYSGTQVLTLIQIILDEGDKAIDESFAEGYKQGLLASAPDTEYWKARAVELEKQIRKSQQNKWLFALGGFCIGIITDQGISFALRLIQ